MSPVPTPFHILSGCTGVGKTELALRWAEAHDAEIISCDSLLFYRGMDIGTAKPTKAELGRVRHHLIDICEPAEQMDVKRYVELAHAAIAAIEERGRQILVVGGSGFYLRSFFAAVADEVPVDPDVRDQLERRLSSSGLDSVVEELRVLNPQGLGELDTQNPRRVLRALERCLVSGRTLEALGREFRALPAPFPNRRIHVTVLERNEEDLRDRIERRAAAMIADGLIDEVRSLQSRGFESNPSACGAIGYREVLARLKGGVATDDLAAEISRNTWQLARKQRTWFRSQLPQHRVVTLPENGTTDAASLFE